MVDLAENAVNRSINIRCGLVGCRSTKVREACHLDTETDIVWDDLEQLDQQ